MILDGTAIEELEQQQCLASLLASSVLALPVKSGVRAPIDVAMTIEERYSSSLDTFLL
jgi:hypothetical protein